MLVYVFLMGFVDIYKNYRITKSLYLTPRLICSTRAAQMRSVKSVTSSLQPGQTTGCLNIPPPSWPSFAGSRPAILQMRDPWLSIAGMCLCIFSSAHPFLLFTEPELFMISIHNHKGNRSAPWLCVCESAWKTYALFWHLWVNNIFKSLAVGENQQESKGACIK